jgi:lycopene cyclase domain-containing protein
MSSPWHAYLFLELAAFAYLIGFGRPYLQLIDLLKPEMLKAASLLIILWFIIDQIALALGIWTFPEGGSLPIRFFGLPLEECLVLLLHTLVCYVLVQRSLTKQ